MEDILPEEAERRFNLEMIAREHLETHGYKEIRTPVLEDAAVFTRSIGEASDIVSKEMYTFNDKKGRLFAMRPEGTAPIVRAYIEHGIDKAAYEPKLYYMGPMFRSERPQKGRSRQFYQIGVEVFGTGSVYADAEVLSQLSGMLKLFGIRGFTLKLNTLGCKNDKEKYSENLKNYLEREKNRLCPNCRERMNKNALRVLDCKVDPCRALLRNAPDIKESLCQECGGHFNKLKNILKEMNIKFKEERNLVRGLDYYTGTVFEITHEALGAQDALGAGGRYDNLVKDMGGRETGAIGYAIGVERVMLAINKEAAVDKKKTVFLATLGDKAKIEGMKLARQLRENCPRLVVVTDIREASLKAQMRSADKSGALITVILGEDEIAKKEALLRNMATKEQIALSMEEIVKEIKNKLFRGQ